MSLYLWTKALHLVFVASWFAGLFYLPRLFVNLAMVPPDSHAERERLLLALNTHVLTADSRAFGLGSVRRERVERNVRAVAKAFDLPTTLKVEQVWTDRFLPPIAERRITGQAR